MEVFLYVLRDVGFAITALFGLFAGFIMGFVIWLDREKKGTYNKLSIEEAIKLQHEGYLVLSPKGDTQDFVFGEPKQNFSCGDAYFGMTIDAHKHVDKYKGIKFESFNGGVIGLEDCIRLRDHLSKHIEAMAILSNKSDNK